MIETIRTTDVPSEEEEIIPFYCANGRITALAMTQGIEASCILLSTLSFKFRNFNRD